MLVGYGDEDFPFFAALCVAYILDRETIQQPPQTRRKEAGTQEQEESPKKAEAGLDPPDPVAVRS